MFCASDAPSILTNLSTLVGSYLESTIPLAYCHEPKLKFLHKISTGSDCAMNVPNYYERKLELAGFVQHDNQVGCLVILSCDP